MRKALVGVIIYFFIAAYTVWGQDAMGEVYRAHQLNLKRDVAIKVISQEMLQSFEDYTEENR